MPEVKLIAAIDEERGLAKDGHIPWDLPSDRRRFRELTEGKIVILGKKSYEEMRPMLGSRKAYVVSRSGETVEGAETIHDLPAFLQNLSDDVWVVGGGQIFAISLPFATRLYLTHVTGDFECEIYFPEFADKFEVIEQDGPYTENGIKYIYKTWVPNNS